MSNALIELQLEGAEKVIAQLETVLRLVESIGGGGGGVGAPGGTSTGGVGAPNVATPTASPTNLSQAAATAGTGGLPPSTAPPPPGASQPGGAPQNPNAPTPPTLQQLMDTGIGAIGGYLAFERAVQVATSVAAQAGQSAATGAPFQNQNLISGGVMMGSIAAGAALGGPLGAGVGAIVGGIGTAYVEPLVQQSIQNEQYARTYQALYGRAPAMNFRLGAAQALNQFAQSGNPMSMEMAEYLGGADGRNSLGKYFSQDNWFTPIGLSNKLTKFLGMGSFEERLRDAHPAIQWMYGGVKSGLALPGREKEFMESVNRAGYSPAAINALGRVVSMDRDASYEDVMDLVGAVGSSDPALVLGMIANMNREKLTDAQRAALDSTRQAMKGRLVEKTRNESRIEAFSSMLSGQQAMMQMAAQSGGQAGFRGAVGTARSYMSTIVSTMRSEALKETNLELRAAKLFEAQMLEKGFNFGTATQDFQLGLEEFSAASALSIGNAGRSVERAIYTGDSWDRIPFARQAQEVMNQARGIEQKALEGRASGVVGPAEFNRMMNDAADLRQQATVAIPRAREQMRNESMMLGGQERGLGIIEGNLGRRLYGSAVDQAGGGYDMAANLRAQKAALDDVIRSSEKLTDIERRRLEMGSKQLEIQAQQAEAQAAYASIRAGLSTDLLGNAEAKSPETLRLISGVGGRRAFEAKKALRDLALKDVRDIEGRLAETERKYGRDSTQAQEIRGALLSAREQAAHHDAGLTMMPMTAHDGIRLMNLQTEMMAMQSGYAGGPGAIRGNLISQMDAWNTRIRELNEMAAKLGGEANMEPEQRLNYQRQLNEARRQLISLQSEYDNGSFERILSQAVNMGDSPGVGMVQAMYGRRAASEAGMDTMHHGGNYAWAQRMIGRTLRLMTTPGGATPEGALREAASQGEITVRLIVQGDREGITQKAEVLRAGQEMKAIYDVPTGRTD